MLKDFNGKTPQVHPSVYISEQTTLIGSVTLAADVSVWPGCVMRADIAEIVIGEGSNLQDGALVHTNHGMPVIMGRGVTVGHGAIIHGCRIGDNCLIGMGAILLDGVVVEDNCIIGAGSVVAEHTVVPAGSLVLGVPGRVKRSLSEEEIKKIAINADEYKELARTYRNAK